MYVVIKQTYANLRLKFMFSLQQLMMYYMFRLVRHRYTESIL